jgi:hypothetical protein
MQTIIVTLLFGVTCTLVLWAAGPAAMTRDRLMRDYGFVPASEV